MSVRPPLPRRVAPPTPTSDVKKNRAQASSAPSLPPRGPTATGQRKYEDIPDLTRLLARKPPPPPLPAATVSKRLSTLSDMPTPRRGMTLTPFSVAMHLATPATPPTPPPVNLASKPAFSVEVVEEETTPSCIECRDFSSADAHAACFPRHTIRSVEELAYALAAPFTEEIDKARVAFTWLHHNIAYDTGAFFSGNIQASSAESTLASGLAVCDGYAGLFERLTELMGLQTHKVTGHGKGYGYTALAPGDPLPQVTMNHAWNCISIDGEWRLVDPCWGSGHLGDGGIYTAKFAPKWFTCSPTEFGTRHFPEDPSFQLTPEEFSWEDYILAPESPPIPPIFEELGFTSMTLQPSTKYIPERQFITFSISKRCEHMSTAEEDNYVFVIKTSDKDFTPLRYDNNQGAWTANVFTPRAGTVFLYAVDTIDGQDAFGVGVAAYSQAKGKKGMSFKGLATWTITHL
ncbi:hypothetical protein CPC08DRAFT_740524 [Agrocybe pediades]|nr:hypothetical protein CPC08DRAFT_740524 [Agrocybe pediades]